MKLRVAFGIAVLIVLLLFLDWSFVAKLSPGQYATSGLVTLALTLCVVFESERLRALCQNAFSAGEMMRIVLIGYFVMNFTPSSFGGDGYKVFALRNRFGYSGAVALVFLERSLGLLVLLTVAFVAMLIFGGQWVEEVIQLREKLQFDFNWNVTWALGVLGVMLAAILLVMWFWREKSLDFIRNFLATLGDLSLSAIFKFSAITFCLHILRSALLCVLVGVFGYQLDIGQAWVVLTVAALASILPLSPGGLGIREAAMVAALAPFAVGYQVALLVSLIFRLPNVAQAAIGALLSAGGRKASHSPNL